MLATEQTKQKHTDTFVINFMFSIKDQIKFELNVISGCTETVDTFLI